MTTNSSERAAVQVVRASIKHLPQLRVIWAQEFSRFGYDIELYESMFFDLDAHCWVCICKNSVVGELMAVNHGGAMEITSIAVLAEKRRRGVARTLVTTAMSYAEGSDVREVFFHTQPGNKPAIRLFEDFGFRFASVDGVYHTGELAHLYRALL